MKLLAIESSGLTASAALISEGLLLGEFTVTNRLNHSETLLPMTEQLLKFTAAEREELCAVAVSAGPGSFTGLRIGAATAKGLALALGIPLVRVSSLEALAYNVRESGKTVCPIMDARRGQVYCAAYREGKPVVAEHADSIGSFLKALTELPSAGDFLFLGDGVPVHEKTVRETLSERAFFAGPSAARQRASSVAELGLRFFTDWLSSNGLTAEAVKKTGADGISCFDDSVMHSDSFVPEYLRIPQAERELRAGNLADAGQKSLEKIARGSR